MVDGYASCLPMTRGNIPFLRKSHVTRGPTLKARISTAAQRARTQWPHTTRVHLDLAVFPQYAPVCTFIESLQKGAGWLATADSVARSTALGPPSMADNELLNCPPSEARLTKWTISISR